jgi:hypothetical protein
MVQVQRKLETSKMQHNRHVLLSVISSTVDTRLYHPSTATQRPPGTAVVDAAQETQAYKALGSFL